MEDHILDPREYGEDIEERYWHTLAKVMAHYSTFVRQMAARGVGRGTLTRALRARGIEERQLALMKDGKRQQRYWGPLKLPIH